MQRNENLELELSCPVAHEIFFHPVTLIPSGKILEQVEADRLMDRPNPICPETRKPIEGYVTCYPMLKNVEDYLRDHPDATVDRHSSYAKTEYRRTAPVAAPREAAAPAEPVVAAPRVVALAEPVVAAPREVVPAEPVPAPRVVPFYARRLFAPPPPRDPVEFEMIDFPNRADRVFLRRVEDYARNDWRDGQLRNLEDLAGHAKSLQVQKFMTLNPNPNRKTLLKLIHKDQPPQTTFNDMENLRYTQLIANVLQTVNLLSLLNSMYQGNFLRESVKLLLYSSVVEFLSQSIQNLLLEKSITLENVKDYFTNIPNYGANIPKNLYNFFKYSFKYLKDDVKDISEKIDQYCRR